MKCVKWNKIGNRYQCVQCKEHQCGCDATVNIPTVDSLLHTNQRQQRKSYISQVKNHIKNGQAALVLGAGISKPSEMPLWGPLISEMMGYAIQYDLMGKDEPRLYTKESPEGRRLLEQSGNLIGGNLQLLGKVNPLESAEYVVQLFYDGVTKGQARRQMEEAAVASMICRIVNASKTPEDLLFGKAPPLPDLKDALSNGTPLPEAVKGKGMSTIAARNTMFAVAYLLSAANGIGCAMTYNYDPLVQEHMLDLFGVEEAQLITHPGQWNNDARKTDGLREIYHIHGFVPGQRHLDRHCERVFPSSSGPLILSEDSYYRIEREEAYNWSSSIQSYFLNRYNCLFVGFSADDYNFRRILRQRGVADGTYPSHVHYLILTVDDWVRDIYQDVCRANIAKDSTMSVNEIKKLSQDSVLLLQYALEARADYWKRFGIIPIWITVNEIPQLLTSLLES